MSELLIRPHHMLCLQFFEGKGYSEEFIANMMNIKDLLEEENPIVNIIESVDDICAGCPNNIGEKCKQEDSVRLHDQRVYEQVIEQVGNRAAWDDIVKAIRKNIIEAGKIRQVCVQCQWSDICFMSEK